MSVDDDGLRRRATASISWVVAERWASRLLSLGVLAILSRVLGPSDFGLISMATAVVALVQVFVDSGFSRALVQRKSLVDLDVSTAFWASVAMSVVLAGGLALCAPFIAALLGEPQLAPVIQALSLSLPLLALSQTPAAMLERDLDFKPLSIRQLIGTVGGALVAIPLALLGFGVWALVAQTVIGALCATIALWASTSWRPSLQFSWGSLRGLWSVGGAILGIDLLDAIQANIDKLVVGAFFDPTTLGYYFLAQRVGTILIELVTSVMSRVSLTTFSRVQDDRQRVDRIFRQLTFAASAVSVPVFGLVAVFAEQIVNGVFGPGWEQAVPILWILAPGWALGAVMYFDRNVLIATEHTRAALILAVVQNAVSIVLVFVFIPFGVLGVAFSRLARFVTWPARLVVLHRLAGIAIGKYLLQIGRAIAAMSPFIVVCALLQLTPWASSDHALWTFALPLAGLSLVGYAGVLWLIAGTESRALIARVITDVRRRGRAAE